jgi:PmbA protein
LLYDGTTQLYLNQVSISPFCFYLDKGEHTEQQLLKQMGDGLYITQLKGLHAGADAVTGDFSLEAAGFRVREGKIAEPVKTLTIAGNFLDLLRGIEAVSDTVAFGYPITAFASADVLVRGLSVAGE